MILNPPKQIMFESWLNNFPYQSNLSWTFLYFFFIVLSYSFQ